MDGRADRQTDRQSTDELSYRHATNTTTAAAAIITATRHITIKANRLANTLSASHTGKLTRAAAATAAASAVSGFHLRVEFALQLLFFRFIFLTKSSRGRFPMLAHNVPMFLAAV